MDDAQVVLALEQRRCAAIGAGDTATLRALLTDDYAHVHMTGATDDCAGHLRAVSERPREVIRGELTVRVYGELAVLTGQQINRSRSADGSVTDVTAFCHQVAVKVGEDWRFACGQLTPMAT
jgi:hypothetical protein